MELLNQLNKPLQRVARYFGFCIGIHRYVRDGCYETVMVNATYAPWLTDKEFNKTYDIIKDSTFVDKYRCYELWQLVTESRKLTGALIEVGVWRGGTGALIAKSAQFNGIQDTVYLCDTFTGVPKAGVMDTEYKGGEHSDSSPKIVEQLINCDMKLTNTKILKGVFPDQTSDLVDNENFRFCHIDVDVYQSAKDIVNWIWPKMVDGGIIVYDDYGFKGCEGITTFVNEERKLKDRLVIHNTNGHAVMIKINESSSQF